jgi:PfaD family protein
MPQPTPLDGLLQRVLAAYGATSARVEVGDRVASTEGVGGGLVLAVERHGVGPLVAALPDGGSLVLQDADTTVELRRAGSAGTLHVAWAEGPKYEEAVSVPAGGASLLERLDPAERAVPRAQEPAGTRGELASALEGTDLVAALHDPARPLWVSATGIHDQPAEGGAIPPVSPESLGADSFRAAHGVRAAYVAGAMAGGIGSAEIVIAMSRAGLLGFYGAGGLPVATVREAVARIKAELGDAPAGFNLLHNPVEPAVEEATVDLYLEHGCRTVSASAYMRLTPAVVRFRLAGIRAQGDRVVCPNRVFAKVSRPEVAEQFMRPAPPAILDELVSRGALTRAQAELARQVPVAEDVTAEADSGGHTDRRPLVVLLPSILALRDRIAAEEGYADRGIALRVGAAGGLGDPTSVHAAFAMGADYVLTGSVNQSAIEAGTSPLAKQMVAEAGIADCTLGPAPDMFELGAQVQVLGRGTLYAQRAGRLHDLYEAYGSLGEIPAADRRKIEKQVFRRSLDEVWEATRAYWADRDPAELKRAERDPHHEMALCFRWYLGLTSRWARTGDADRKRDFQVWCGPAMGRFNDWVRGTWLEPLEARRVVDIAWALLGGAAALRRVEVARGLGVRLPSAANLPAPWRP